MNFSQEFRKIKTANLLAIVLMVYIMVFSICLFFFIVPKQNERLMDTIIYMIVTANGAICGYLYGTRKSDEDKTLITGSPTGNK